MRHNIKGRKLGRTASHKSAVLNSLATSLFRHKRIRTTLAKAKEARGFIEGIITKARKNDLNARRQVMKVINDKEVVKELFNDIVPKVGERPGGYTRVIKLGNRKGDAASIAIIELVDYNDVANKKAEALKDKKELKKEAKKKDKEIEEAKVVEETSQEEEPKPEKEKKETKAKKGTKAKTKPEKKDKPVKEAKPKKETKAKKESKPKEEKPEKKDKKKK